MFIVGFLDGSACGYERDLAHGYKVMPVVGRWWGGWLLVCLGDCLGFGGLVCLW